MTKKDLANVVSRDTNITIKQATEILDSCFENIIKHAGEQKLVLPIGTFEVVQRSARMGRNPQTGEAINIPASKAVKFKASKNFKESVQ